MDRAVAQLDHDRLVARLKLDRRRRRRFGSRSVSISSSAQASQWLRTASLGLLLGHQRNAPAGQILEHRPKLLASWGEAKQGGGDWGRGIFTSDDAGVLEFAQPLGEQVGGDPGEPVAQVGVPARAAQRQLADDQQRPAVADHIQRFRDRAVLVV